MEMPHKCPHEPPIGQVGPPTWQLEQRYQYIPELQGNSYNRLQLLEVLPVDEYLLDHILCYLDYRPIVHTINDSAHVFYWVWCKEPSIVDSARIADITLDITTHINDTSTTLTYNKYCKQRSIVTYLTCRAMPVVKALQCNNRINITIVSTDVSYDLTNTLKLIQSLSRVNNINKLTLSLSTFMATIDQLDFIFSTPCNALCFKHTMLDYSTHRHILELQRQVKSKSVSITSRFDVDINVEPM